MQARREYRIKLRLLEGEEILHAIGHHAISGVAALIIPVGLLLIALSLYGYTALGGGFTAARDSMAGQLALIDWLLLLLAGALAIFWLLLGSIERSGYRGMRWSLVVMLALVLAVVAYRASGGRLFAPDPSGPQPLSPPGLLLLLLALALAFQSLYTLVDLINDQLILTNMRVIYFNGAVLIPRLIEKQVQRDVMLEDIQNVASRTETYLQHWLGYSTIKVETATFGAPLIFRAANDAREMQRRIMTERRRLLQQQTERNFDQLVATRVYADQAERPNWSYPFRVFAIPGPLRWLLNDNPLVDPAQRSLTWYPHWIFLARDLIWPLGALVIAIALLALVAARAWPI